jgi:hypothetical protein
MNACEYFLICIISRCNLYRQCQFTTLAIANDGLEDKHMYQSFHGVDRVFVEGAFTLCNSDRIGKTDEEQVEEIRKLVEAKQVQFVY